MHKENNRITLDLKKYVPDSFETESAITKPLIMKNKSIKTAQYFTYSPASSKKLNFVKLSALNPLYR